MIKRATTESTAHLSPDSALLRLSSRLDVIKSLRNLTQQLEQRIAANPARALAAALGIGLVSGWFIKRRK